MEVKRWLKQPVAVRNAISYGDNPHREAIGKHLEEAHGHRPVALGGYQDIDYYTLFEDHRAALVAGDITVVELSSGG